MLRLLPYIGIFKEDVNNPTQDTVLNVSQLTDNDDFIWASKQESKNEAQGPGNIGIQSWEPKPEVIQSGSQKPNMGYSQYHMVRSTGQDTNGNMFEWW